MKKVLLGTAATAAFILAAWASSDAQEKMTLKVATFTPAGTFIVERLFKPFLDKVVAESEGTLDYKIFSGGTLGRNPAEQLSLVQNGIADIAYVVPSYMPGVYDAYNVSQLPLVTDNSEQTAAGMWNAYEKGLLPSPEGVKLLGVFANGQNGLHLVEAADSASDVNGRKIRVGGQIQMSTIEALGAIPVGNIGAPSVAESISRGVVEGSFMDWGAIQSYRVDRTTSYHIDFPFGTLPVMIPISQETWEKLSVPAKAAFEKYGGRTFSIEMGRMFDQYGKEARAEVAARGGHTVIELTEGEREKLQALVRNVVLDWTAAADGRQAILDAYREGASGITE